MQAQYGKIPLSFRKFKVSKEKTEETHISHLSFRTVTLINVLKHQQGGHTSQVFILPDLRCFKRLLFVSSKSKSAIDNNYLLRKYGNKTFDVNILRH